MAYDVALRDRALDALAALGEVHGRAMFGGYGTFEGEAMFALIAADTLYFKTDDASKVRYQEAGSSPFNPYGDAEWTLKYYAVPEAVLDDPDAVIAWGRQAVEVGHRTRRPRRSRRSRQREQ